MKFADWLIGRALLRAPDFLIGGQDRPYLRRWWLIPRNPVFNIYLHQFLRSDDDRAHHDHPWPGFTLMLHNEYTEHTIRAGGVHVAEIRRAGDWKAWLSGTFAHRLELHAGPCWTLFVTGPRYRAWGFHCPTRWVHWTQFTAQDDKGAIGKGCEQ